MFRIIFYPLSAALLGGIVGIVGEVLLKTVSLVLPVIGMILGGIAGWYVASRTNRYYENHPSSFLLPLNEKNAALNLSALTGLGRIAFLILFVIALTLIRPSDESLDTFMATPWLYILEILAYIVSVWFGVWLLKRNGYVQPKHSRHTLALNVVLIVLAVSVATNWETIAAYPLVSIASLIVTGALFYLLTRLIIDKIS